MPCRFPGSFWGKAVSFPSTEGSQGVMGESSGRFP